MSDNNQPSDPSASKPDGVPEAPFPWRQQDGASDAAPSPESSATDGSAPEAPVDPPAPPAPPAEQPASQTPPESPAWPDAAPANETPPVNDAAPAYSAQPPYGGAQPYGTSPVAPPADPYGASPAPYGAPSPYGTAAPQRQGGKGLAITALVLSIVGALMCFIPFAVFLGIVIVLAALILAIIALVKKANGKGMSIAALIVSIVGMVVGVFILFITIATMGFIGDVMENPDQYLDNPELFDEDFDTDF